MSDIVKVKPQLDWGIHVQNRAKWTIEELRPYVGHWVAWSLDGTRIVASDADPLALTRKLDAMGIADDEVVISGEHFVGEFEVEL